MSERERFNRMVAVANQVYDLIGDAAYLGNSWSLHMKRHDFEQVCAGHEVRFEPVSSWLKASCIIDGVDVWCSWAERETLAGTTQVLPGARVLNVAEVLSEQTC